ncbi:MAG: FAD-dependent oxidoreductase [Methylococcaceae bacterium]|nr:FAD-dependent oxidoreductase [Methylococcaceae bacterium]
MAIKKDDFLIIGAGIIGFAVARSLRQRDPACSIRILEKESSAGCHASGRNSGVLHAGFYYSGDSLKARFTRDGNQRMRAYCIEHSLPINECGKLVVATREEQIAGLEELFRRATLNGIETSLITAAEARELEPRVRTLAKALWSPTTSSVDPLAIMQALERELNAARVQVDKGVGYLSGSNALVKSSKGRYSTGHLINAAGLYADRIAHGLGFGLQYRVAPFKGLYLYANERIGAFKRHLYPAPNLNNPFLGVHFTLTVDRGVKIGPTAIPALWREQYSGLKGFNLREISEALRNNAALFFKDPRGYRSLAGQEMRKIFKKAMVDEAARMAIDVDDSMFSGWGPPGIRAQLLNVAERSLAGDFVVDGDLNSTHILNAVSPAFTCAFPFADYVVERIYGR